MAVYDSQTLSSVSRNFAIYTFQFIYITMANVIDLTKTLNLDNENKI